MSFTTPPYSNSSIYEAVTDFKSSSLSLAPQGISDASFQSHRSPNWRGKEDLQLIDQINRMKAVQQYIDYEKISISGRNPSSIERRWTKVLEPIVSPFNASASKTQALMERLLEIDKYIIHKDKIDWDHFKHDVETVTALKQNQSEYNNPTSSQNLNVENIYYAANQLNIIQYIPIPPDLSPEAQNFHIPAQQINTINVPSLYVNSDNKKPNETPPNLEKSSPKAVTEDNSKKRKRKFKKEKDDKKAKAYLPGPDARVENIYYAANQLNAIQFPPFFSIASNHVYPEAQNTFLAAQQIKAIKLVPFPVDSDSKTPNEAHRNQEKTLSEAAKVEVTKKQKMKDPIPDQKEANNKKAKTSLLRPHARIDLEPKALIQHVDLQEEATINRTLSCASVTTNNSFEQQDFSLGEGYSLEAFERPPAQQIATLPDLPYNTQSNSTEQEFDVSLFLS